MIIRPIRVDDRERCGTAVAGYLDFCRAVLTPEVTEGTWATLCDPTSAVHGLVAEQEDHLAGLAYLVLHPTTWASHPTCYLEDLYAKQWRGGDVAKRLIAAVYASDGFGPASSARSTTPRHAPYTTPRPSDIVFGIPALSLPEDSARCGRRRRLPRPIRCATHKRRSPCLPASPRSTGPRRSASLNGRVVVTA